MIKSFTCSDTKAVFDGESPRRFPPEIIRPAFRKLVALENALILADLAVTPACRLEKLKGDLKGWWSIRVNKQYRLVFRWNDGMAENVKIADYH
jgi:proteic killer suppression protein